MDPLLARALEAYWDAMERWRASLLDLHTNYHDESVALEECTAHRCHEYAWTAQRHGRLPRPPFRER